MHYSSQTESWLSLLLQCLLFLWNINSYSSEDLRFISLSYFPRNNKTSKAVWTSFPSLSSRPCCCLTHLIGAKSNFWSPCETSKYLTHELLLQDCSTTIDLHPFFWGFRSILPWIFDRSAPTSFGVCRGRQIPCGFVRCQLCSLTELQIENLISMPH